MPEIDVTDVMLSSEIAGEEFVVWRRIETISPQGRSVVQTFAYQAFGNIQPSGDNKLDREEDFDIQTKTFEVTTPFKLRGATKDAQGNSFKPDFILWNGDTFVVTSAEDCSQYGGGFVSAECSSEDFVDEPPIGPPAPWQR